MDFVWSKLRLEMPSDGLESSDSSSEDEETQARLREAVDNKFHKAPEKARTTGASQEDSSDSSKIIQSRDISDYRALSDNIKLLVERYDKKSKKENNIIINPKSLRRDKQDDVELSVMSELDVTPQFQKFVGSKLDLFLSEQIEDSVCDTEVPSDREARPSVKLLSRSRKTLENADCDTLLKRPRPDLLSHRSIQPSDQDLSNLAVSGEFVLSKTDTAAWVNKFPDRTEPGVERIKKKKKKVKKKKKTEEADTMPTPSQS